MAEFISYFCVLVVFYINCVDSNIEFINPTSLNIIEGCTAECAKRSALDSNSVSSSDSCSRGCRFFAIALAVNGNDALGQEAASRESCTKSCQASYGEKNSDSESCILGCRIYTPQDDQPMMSVIHQLTWYVLNDNGGSLQVFQGFLAEPDDVLTDASLKSQVSKMEYLHIPEMRVRTLPVSTVKEESVGSGWWGGCGSGRGVPHCLAASLLLLLILLALWFGLTLEEQPGRDDQPVKKCAFVKSDDVQAPSLPEKVPLV